MAEEGKLSINIVTPAGEKLSGQADGGTVKRIVTEELQKEES